ncbi:MAG: hypothetical protein RIE86_10105 [Imperialibacter sp.]
MARLLSDINALLRSVCVLPKYRDGGHGKLIVEKLVKFAEVANIIEFFY